MNPHYQKYRETIRRISAADKARKREAKMKEKEREILERYLGNQLQAIKN